MKMFRRIFALTMVIAMVCLFSASAFAEGYTRSVAFDGGDMYVYTDIERYEAYCDVGLITGDVVGNYISIDIAGSYYATQQGFYNNDMRYDADAYEEVYNEVFCSARVIRNDIYWMYRAIFTSYAEGGFGAYASDVDVHTMYCP